VSNARPSRIALICTSYPRGSDDAAGHFVRTEARQFASRGHDVHVVCPGTGLRPFSPAQEPGITIWPAGGGSAFGSPGVEPRLRQSPWRIAPFAGFVWSARRRLHAIGLCDRVIAHWLFPCGWPLATSHATTDSGALEVVAHGADVRALMLAPRHVRHHVVRSMLARGASFRFAAQALYEAFDAETRSLLDGHFYVAAPAIEIPVVDPAQVRSRYGKPMVVVVSRLIKSKRVHLAIDAMNPSHVDEGHLVVVGDGPERQRLEARADHRGIRATFLGARPRKEALTHIAAADVLLHPSDTEAAPTVIREARALGTPVVCFDIGDAAAWASTDPGIHIASSANLPEALTRAVATG
jgi:teichuronic acid biosynthesis glycosyltransferase TuaC